MGLKERLRRAWSGRAESISDLGCNQNEVKEDLCS